MGKNLYKEYLKKQKLKEKYKEEVVVNEQSPVMKALLFLFSILCIVIFSSKMIFLFVCYFFQYFNR